MLKHHILIFVILVSHTLSARIGVIGGGFAGLAAAAELEKNGIDYVLLEASDRLGGRVYPIQDKDGNVIQLGAEYINGVDNEIYRLAEALGVIDRKESDYWMFQANNSYGIGGGQFSRKDLKTFQRFADPIEEEMEHAALTFPEMSVEDFINRKYRAFLYENENENKEVFDALVKLYKSYYESEWSAPVKELALDNFQEWDDKTNDSSSWFLKGDGFKAILDALKKNITFSNVRLNSRVDNIDWSEDYVSVTLMDSEDNLNFDHVIVTVPLGHLKLNPNLFTPKLSKTKRDAIKYLGFGRLQKVFLDYDRVWWNPASEVLMTVTLGDNAEGPKLTDSIKIFYVVENRPSTLLLWLDGDGPKIAANLTNENLADVITLYLRTQFHNTDIPNPTAIYTHNWSADELIGGAYSYITPASYENLNDSYGDMASPVIKDKSPMICFAGEHTHQTMYQTTVGAYESGIREAQRLAEHLKSGK